MVMDWRDQLIIYISDDQLVTKIIQVIFSDEKIIWMDRMDIDATGETSERTS